MLARLKITLVAILCLALLAPGGMAGADAADNHGWTVYSGRENGVRMTFELKGRRLVPAVISLPVVCGGAGPRHRHQRFEEWQNRHYPILVDRHGRFSDTTDRRDSYGSETQRVVGRVTPNSIEGTILEIYVQPARVGIETCRTGKSPRKPAKKLNFRAYRHRL